MSFVISTNDSLWH